MQETTTSTTQSEHNYSISAVDLADKLPLRLINSDVIPPAPTRSEYTIDWLPDFSGYSWLAYASSSLLVISHLPSPLSDTETNVGPIFRQVFELSGSDNESGHVSGVTWSSSGELAAALDNCIRLFSFDSTGSFCWSQTTALIQSTKVEAVEWTGSGDGIISVGIEVVLWRKKCTSWEIAWKFKPELTQSLVSATWSIEGYFATAPRCNHVEGSSSTTNSASKSVVVYHSDRISKYVKTVLPHPLPVLMIQWRPSPIKQDARHQRRLLLLTCCMDGTIRLWTEIDDGRVRKVGKDIHDQRTRKLLFHVCSVIEINHAMNGSLGSDIHVRWATEISGIFNTSKEASQYFPSEYYQPDGVGKCEWVVGFGPHKQVSLWAVHCLDDVTPLRYPRVTLWKRRELEGPEVGRSSLLLRKVIIMRDQVSSPPILCNLIQLLSCNSFAWWQISSQTLTSSEEPFTKSQRKSVYSYCVYGKLNMDGHSGKILQVSVHSHGYGFNFAASLDMEGFLLLWSISDNSNSIVGLPTIYPTWKLSGKVALHDCTPNYTTLGWLPPVIDEDPILLAGHAGGIDCFVVELSKKEEKLFSHKLCTIPFSSSSCIDGPNSVHAVPLSLCDENSYYCATMLLAVWNNSFKALSWKISIHHSDFSGICACTFDTGNISKNNARMFEENISGKRYFIVLDPWSSVLPEIQNHSHVTNYDVVSPTTIVMPKKLKEYSATELHGSYGTFHLATGHSDGRVRLWRSMATNSLNLDSQWELVSVLDTHQSQIMAVSVTDCGRKIATITSASHSDSSTILHIWEAVYLSVAGSFILEDSVVLDGKVVALDWLTLDNGQFLLGVCLRNQFRVYGQRLCGGHNLLKNESSLNRKIWVCVALNHTHPEIQHFKWGLNASAVVVHNEYFSLCSPWLILHDNKSNINCLSRVSKNKSLDCISADKHMVTSIFRDPDTGALRDSSMEEKQRHCPIRFSNMINAPINILSSIYADNYNSDVKIGFISMLDVAEKLGGYLPFYHPEALLMNICSGNWKRAEVSVRDLADYYTSQSVSSESYCLANSGHVIPLVHLSDYFNGSLSSNSDDNAFQWRGDAASNSPTLQLQHDLNYYATSWDYNTSLTFPSKKFKVGGFTEPLDKFFDLGFLNNIEKMQMRAIIDLLEEISNSASAYGSLDKPGQRFWVAIRFQQLYFLRRFGRVPSEGELVVNTSMIGWAFHSDCQDNLFDSLLSNESSWHEMRNIGVGFWYTNVTQLRLKMEKLARHQYLKSKDPKACALLYIVLNRLQVLAGLFKISKDEKDKPLVGFLSRNFKEDNNKAAALKNAYVLMGKHQLELAVAFFILGGDTASAINVCAKNLGDEQLALVISRLVEGNNGPLQFHLISKFLLPSALEKGDNWLASFLEWAIGNYSQAIVRVLGSQLSTVGDKPAFSSNYDSFLDPSIGEYCLMLATSNNMRNALGEQNAAILGRWAILMTATALNRCGLPLEGLERLSSSYSIFGGSDQGDISEIAASELLNEMLKPFVSDSSSNWISSKIALHIESQGKLDMAMHYISNLLKEHPSWRDANIGYSAMCMYNKSNIQQYQVLLESFEKKLRAGLACFEQKFSLAPHHLINKMVNFLCINGLVFIGLQLLICYNEQVKETSNTFGGFHLFPVFPNLLLKATEEMSFLFSRYVISCSISSSSMRSCSAADRTPGEKRFNRLAGWRFQMQGLMWSLCCFRSMLKLFPGSSADDFIRKTYTMIGLCEYYVYFSSALIQRNLRALNLIVKPLLVTCKSDHVHYEFNLEDLNKLLPEIAELLTHDTIIDEVLDSAPPVPPDHDGDRIPIPIDEEWQIVKALLYGRMSGFLNHQLNSFLTVEEDSSANCLPFRLSVFVSDSSKCGLDNSNTTTQINAISAALANLLRSTSAHIYSHCERQVASSLLQKAGDGFSSPTLQWLEILCHASSQDHLKQLNQDMDNFNLMNNETKLSAYEILQKMCANPELLCGGSELNISRWLKYIKRKLSKRWFELYKSTESECETEEIHKREGTSGSLHASNGVGSGSPLKGSPENSFFLGSRKDTALIKKVMPFESPKEICKRNGELLEAICVNSLNQQQAALASNRKGIVFFNREDGIPSMDNSNYIWSKADWPHDGWAGSESTPVPTCVSPGVGLGSRKGTHLGLGGATVGAGSLAKPGRDFTGGGAFGVPGYAGMGSSGLGWEIQEEFEEFVDPPATVENVRTRAFSSHPSRPLFLVGSSNTHTYLWEFGKERATATYGVLPAANVPPPYALASISAVRFDHCGQRFATAALDGTVCTWQLEVGGRSNICPTESMLCFNNCASDVTYVTASGSIIATAGYSSDAINVVIWDTLAPPTTSRASIMCHEGGARSLAVFDNDIGSGSISPFIVTGGKAGDVGVHDFRYIATGRTKRNRHSDSNEEFVNGSSTTIMRNKIGDQNSHGMLWYIPKAHTGSVTRICAVPNTNFFLTGSKDGDVKLWDAKRAKLVYHWPKLHDRHTFLQGGVIRAAVTDIQVVSNGFLTCGGDSSVKFVQLQDTLTE